MRNIIINIENVDFFIDKEKLNLNSSLLKPGIILLLYSFILIKGMISESSKEFIALNKPHNIAVLNASSFFPYTISRFTFSIEILGR